MSGRWVDEFNSNAQDISSPKALVPDVDICTKGKKEKGVARSLNCTNLDLGSEPPASEHGTNPVSNISDKSDSGTNKKWYRPNPSIPLACKPVLEAEAREKGLSTSQLISGIIMTALFDDASALYSKCRGSPSQMSAEEWLSFKKIANNLNQAMRMWHTASFRAGEGNYPLPPPTLEPILMHIYKILKVRG